MNPYVFFVGCPRSGNTLLGRIGDAHPELAIINQTRWIAEWAVRTGSPGHVSAGLLGPLREDRHFAKLGIDPAAVDRLLAVEDGPVTYGGFVAALFDLYGELRHKSLVGDKTPKYVRWIPTLSELWPDAKFVHLIRDGRDVCLSVLDWRKGPSHFSGWDEDAVSTTALWWEWHVRLGRETGTLLGPERYCEVRYEALLADPEGECTKLCAFLGLAYDPAMLRFHEGRARTDLGLSAKKAWRPITTGLRKWREQMARGDVARFDAATGLLLDELGYARGGNSVSDGELMRAGSLREVFAGEARSRRLAVPVAWGSPAA